MDYRIKFLVCILMMCFLVAASHIYVKQHTSRLNLNWHMLRTHEQQLEQVLDRLDMIINLLRKQPATI